MHYPKKPSNWMESIPDQCADELEEHGILVTNLIGCGDFGCVFNTSVPGRVIKFSFQESEAKSSIWLFNGGLKHAGLPKIYDAWMLDCYVHKNMWPISATLRDDIPDLKVANLDWFELMTVEIEDSMLLHAGKPIASAENLVTSDILDCLTNEPGGEDELLIEELLDLGLFGLSHGFRIDDLLASNMGSKDGNLVIRDLGSIKLL
jgi:hypothetical protein